MMWFVELFIILILALPAFVMALLIFNYCVIRENITEMSMRLNKSKAETKKLYQERLQKAEALCGKEKLSISIRTFEYSFSKDMLNANSTFPRIITISPEWIKKLLSDESYWDVAFIQTIGHELAHKKNEPKPIYWVNKKAIFTNWSRECRADFYGVEFAEKYLSNETRATIISAMRKKYTPSDVSSLTHPSWNLRYSLLTDQKHLNIKVFEEIGAKVGYSDDSYISEIAGKSMNFNLNDYNI